MKNKSLALLYCIVVLLLQACVNNKKTTEEVVISKVEKTTDTVEVNKEETASDNENAEEESDIDTYRKQFIKWIMRDTNTFLQTFTKMSDSLDMYIINSPDKRLRIYYWLAGGGTRTKWCSVTQFRDSSGCVRSFYGIPVKGILTDGRIYDIMVDTIDNTPFYILFYSNNFDTRYRGMYPITAAIQGDRIVEWPKFTGESESYFGISPYFQSSYGETKKKTGVDYVVTLAYYPTSKRIYVPEAMEKKRKGDIFADDCMSGRYKVYEFDGKVFNYIGLKGAPNLYSSLRNYEEMIALFATEQYLVRVDRIEKDDYRLALWKEPTKKRMWHKPSLVLKNGILDTNSSQYIFTKDNVQYSVHEENWSHSLSIKNK